MKKSTLLGLIIVAMNAKNALFASNAIKKEVCNNLKVLTFNIDTNIGRTEESYARESHPEWRVGARMPKIKESLEKICDTHSPDIIHLQEGRNFITKFGDEVDSISPLMEFLQSKGYQTSTEQYNSSDRSFSYITAIKNGFVVDGYEKFYLSKSPDKPTDHTNHAQRLAEIKDHNFGEEWERCIYITKFHDKEGRRYRARNIHLGIVESGRMQACEMMRQDSERAVIQDPEILEVSTGDFNTFPDWGGPKQLEIMAKNNVLQEVTKDLKLPTGAFIDSTFIAFPYDFAADEKRINDSTFKKTGKKLAEFLTTLTPRARKQNIEQTFASECKALCGHLDRIYQHGFENTTATLLPTPLFDDFDIKRFDETSVKDFIMRHHHEGPAFASDHQPILAILDLPQKNSR